jgi:hypothetical protein
MFSSKADLSDGQVVVAGKWRKAAAGVADIPFGHTFAEPPIVVISPLWVEPVAATETITKIEADKFQVVSANAAPNYFVSWIAIGKK